LGRKPSKINLWEGLPDKTKAQTKALGPGITVRAMLFFMAKLMM
jgi:hypothetical protein